MSYTTAGQPQGVASSITNFLRESLIGEIVAINGYTKHIDEISISELRDLLSHIMEDEKKHYGLLLEALRKYDTVECDKYIEASEHVTIKDRPLKNHFSNDHKDSYTILNKLREDIKGELEAILLYESIIDKIDDILIKDLITEIVNDEKEHCEELTLALLRIDKDSYGPLEKCILKK